MWEARETTSCGRRHQSVGSRNSSDRARLQELLVRDEDVEVLHGFETAEQANAYLTSRLFTADVVGALKPLLDAEPDVRIYQAAA